MFINIFEKFYSWWYEKIWIESKRLRFFGWFNNFDISDITNIRKHLMKNDIKQCLSLLKKMFIGLLSASIIGTLDDHISLNDQ